MRALNAVNAETKPPSCVLALSNNGFVSSKHGNKEMIESAAMVQ
jgi:hypothetical protein